MTMVTVLIGIVFFLGVQCQLYSTPYMGAEVIDLQANTTTYPLSYASNIFVDPDSSTNRIWFTADRGSPNLWFAQYNPTGGQKSFWINSSTPVFPQNSVAPFVNFGIVGNNVFGTAYPSNLTNFQTVSLVVQSFYWDSTTNEVTNSEIAWPGYTFFSVIIDPAVNKVNSAVNVYLAGWSNDGFVIGRGLVVVGAGKNPILQMDETRDILVLSEIDKCYDLYNENTLPKMWLAQDYLVLAIPGRCSTIVKVTYPQGNTNWNAATYKVFDPTDTNSKFISSYAFEPTSQTLYYSLKKYDSSGVTILQFNTSTMNPLSQYKTLNDISDSYAVLVIGVEDSKTYLFVAAAGSSRIYKFLRNDTGFSYQTTAFIDGSINQISSAVYIQPHLYYTTYEPDAKIVRIHKNNFCSLYCGQYGYCNLGSCYCKPGYSQDLVNPNTDGTFTCKLSDVVRTEIRELQDQGAIAALSVLFTFSLLSASAGWYLWWKQRQGYENPAERKSILDSNL
eukprot:TRINITY_DN6718_c0_g1_i1.p1 TRINITY_DN6718_c0_g1~~TRINITY_DN6718_c0_g1_i1.p1  ORF type:complete len:503 (+),score=84.27 TRINITY_DN6718_c0_g1_i1:41-1549(+)